ncbi:tetratricopeptide repeat protein [Polaribacter septentrionalilitoris]|uniref:tetratricopeptide repeat protein n=1 Tax=Polaribacter septentrionalilitoris TaxID=2494657 RepID=UPI0013568034|nr:hypothetical protein [Polaribacter septentrionalilitoris]
MENQEFDKHLKKAITAEERKLQKAYLHSVENSLKTSKKKFNWRIAVSIIMLLGLVSYFALFNQSLSNDELYANYFSPYENVVKPIVRDKVKLTKIAEVFSLYEKGKYEKALEKFNKLTPQDAIDVGTLNFYKANTYLQLKQFEKAKTIFSETKNNKEWNQESLWYLALISIKLNDSDAALKNLHILSTKTFKNKEVKELINWLN